MQLHRNARTTPVTRRLIAQRVVQDHWSYAETAEAFGVSVPTVRKWVARHRAEGLAGLEDRSSRPRRSPTITAPALVTAMQQLRTDHGLPAWLIGRALGVPRSTVSAWIRRLGHEDPTTTHRYIEADLAMKDAALRRVDAPSSSPVRFKVPDRLLAFLEAL